MLVFTRRAGESIVVNGNVTITILETGNTVRVGIEAPRAVDVHRLEVHQRIVGASSEQALEHEPETVAMAE